MWVPASVAQTCIFPSVSGKPFEPSLGLKKSSWCDLRFSRMVNDGRTGLDCLKRSEAVDVEA